MKKVLILTLAFLMAAGSLNVFSYGCPLDIGEPPILEQSYIGEPPILEQNLETESDTQFDTQDNLRTRLYKRAKKSYEIWLMSKL